MLATIGVATVEDLFSGVPEKVRLRRPLALDPAVAEAELMKELKRLAARNATVESYSSFLGGGAYNH
ncbi:MAG TPA: glycine dehydrogenase, partial [Desulfuromonas sp.]|nr:glycine dehydrogenase [Desulfuromonas sp.]